MKIETISYERRASDGSYGKRRYHVSASLDEQDHPGEVATALRRFVVDQLSADVQEEEARQEAERLAREEEYKRLRAERDAQYARERDERAALMGRNVAITLPAVEEDDA